MGDSSWAGSNGNDKWPFFALFVFKLSLLSGFVLGFLGFFRFFFSFVLGCFFRLCFSKKIDDFIRGFSLL